MGSSSEEVERQGAGERFFADPYDFGSALAISNQLGLKLPVAAALVRRGLRTPSEVSALIEGAPEHDPFGFDGMDEAVDSILATIRSGDLITVHGDYDADGVCATTILVECLGELGAKVDWYLPDRQSGYGIGRPSIEEVKRRGTSLLISVDCGIGSRDEVAELKGEGVRCIVTDHHEPPDELPDCPVIHPALGYPFRGLCGAGVAWKLARALAEESGRKYEKGIDLVALATVADLVPLVDENRTLVRAGLDRMRTSPRVGVKALMDAASVSQDQVDSGALGFRLAPRINAAGRLYRADAGVELMLSDDPGRAAEIAQELNQINSQRRAIEREVETAAEAARRALPDALREAPALVLAGEGWNPGVVGIVASRLVERHRRPTVLIALDDGVGRGSGRSIDGYDLLSGVTAGAEDLNRFGGHKMAAGLEIDAHRVDSFRQTFCAHASANIEPEQLLKRTRVDAIVAAGSGGVDMELAEQLESLEPFGEGNRKPRFLIPGALIDSVRPMGKEGRHSTFDLLNGSSRVKAVAFGMAEEVSRLEGSRADVQAEVEINRWRESVEARVLVREFCPVDLETIDPRTLALPVDEWTRRLEASLTLEPGDSGEGEIPQAPDPMGREVLDRRDSPAVPLLLDLGTTGEGLAVVSCDAILRRELATAAGSDRLGGPRSVILPGELRGENSDDSLQGAECVFTDWDLIEADPGSLARFTHIAAVDPPWEEGDLASLGSGEGFVHLLWHRSDRGVAESALRARWDVRSAATGIWRGLSDGGGELSGSDLVETLRGSAEIFRPVALVGRALRSLSEVSQVSIDQTGQALRIALQEGGGPLEESPTFTASESVLQRRLASLDGEFLGEEAGQAA